MSYPLETVRSRVNGIRVTISIQKSLLLNPQASFVPFGAINVRLRHYRYIEDESTATAQKIPRSEKLSHGIEVDGRRPTECSP